MKALLKEFLMEIRTSRARFISIFFIVGMGVAFYSGIFTAAPDMRLTSDFYYDTNQLMDLRVMGTMGLTEEDVQALEALEGVESAEGAYATDVLCGKEELQTVIHVESISEKMNQFLPQKGRIPEKSGECFLDESYADAFGYQVGDTIVFRQTQENPFLKKETYTVTGIGNSVMYISLLRGNTTLGSGEVSGFAYVLPEDFEQEVYTQIYLKAQGAENLVSYTKAYDDLLAEIQETVEGLEEERSQFRYETIVSEAQGELDDARKELDDARKEAQEELEKAEKELLDGEKELKEGKEKYEEGKKEYEDGKKQLEEAKDEIASGKNQIAQAKQELSSGQSQLEAAKQQVSEGWIQLAPAKEQLASGQAQLEAAKEELDAGYAELASGKEQLTEGKAQLEAAKEELVAGQSQLDSVKAELSAGKAELESNEAALLEQKTACENGLAQVEAGEMELLSQKEALTALQSTLSAKQQQYDSAVAEGILTEEELGALAAELETLRVQEGQMSSVIAATQEQLSGERANLEGALFAVEGGLQQIEEKKAELAAIEAQIVSGQAELDAGAAQLASKEAELAAAETQIAESQKQLDAGQAEWSAKKVELDAGAAELKSSEAQLAAAQYEISVNEQTLAAGWYEVAQSEQQLAAGEAEIAENEGKLKEAEQELADGEAELADGEAELADGRKKYEDGKKEMEEEFAKAEEELSDAQEKIADIKVPEWYVSDRNALPEYTGYGDNAERIRNIGKVFPWLFFLVAALISLTTMTRMVEEQRTQIGTMKALGYGKFAVAFKYLGYAFLATAGGSVVGVLIGEKILPWIIIKAYGVMYKEIAEVVQTRYEWKYALIGSCMVLLCTMGATFFSCYKTLMETPASLMRPPAPKEGKRTLLERIPFLWKSLSFSWKSTLRNMFRYKKRLLMTIFGIAGSMALMLIGFGIHDSIMGIALIQYEDLHHYDGMLICDEEATEEEKEELLQYVKNNEKISSVTSVELTTMTVSTGKADLSVYLYVPENLETFREDVTLRNRESGELYELTDAGAAVSEKTAKMLNLQVGDEIILENQQKQYAAKIAVITENYMGHYIYMSPKVYEETFGEEAQCLHMVFKVTEEAKGEIESMGNEILTYPAALSINYTESIAGQLERMLGSLGMVIAVLIISAGMLAFVVLYNLNNINITERQRELATLKVLGFYDNEVSMYVFRENILLTLIGILAGCGLGKLLHRFIIVTVEVDAVMFGRNVNLISFVYCAVITVLFSLFVNGVMHFKLKKINMVESLKSVE